ncbi:phosphodiester glycosidase family protein [Prosthecobacter fluviatilis]|uniref:Phosphodiester glycosidase family protein n=1 Tax=Prosthecobacter fluviatilis TaxID=445931 RepID=A0ABW0KMK1_9BACT
MRLQIFILALALAGCATTPPPKPAPPATGSEPGVSVPGYPTPEEAAAQPQPPPSKAAEWSAISRFNGQPLHGNASLIEYQIGHKSQSYQIRVVVFDSRQFDLKVIDQPEDWAGGGRIKEAMQGAAAVAGVNGGFFTREFKPMGLMVSDGRRVGTWQTGPLLTGAVVVSSHLQLLWNSEVKADEAHELVQAGPRLVDDGKAVPGLDTRKRSARTFIAHDGGTQWLIGTAEEISLSDLAELLSTPGLMPAFTVQRALNLDGGHSSAFYYRTVDGREHVHPGWSTVRNYLGIVPR